MNDIGLTGLTILVIEDEVLLRKQIAAFLGKAGHDFDFALRQKGGHWGINILVGAGDGESFFAHGCGDRGHRRAADADEVNGVDRGKHFIWDRIYSFWPGLHIAVIVFQTLGHDNKASRKLGEKI